MRTNTKALIVIMILTGVSISADALEVNPRQRLTGTETLSDYSQMFKNTIAPASLKKLVDPSAPATKPALVDLAKLDTHNLISRLPLTNNPAQAEYIHKLSIREQTAMAIGGINAKVLAGLPLTAEEKEFLSRIQTY